MGASSGQSTVELIVQGNQSHSSLQLNQFDFHLPDRLIAQHPAEERSQSRLLVVGNQKTNLTEIRFSELGQLLKPGDLLICNDSKVIPARLAARKSTGGRVEILVERVEDERQMQAQLKARRPLRIDDSIFIDDTIKLTIIGRNRDLFVLQSEPGVSIQSMIDRYGSVPLPPYISRPIESGDQNRYQTVYARYDGSVAAPTAGLHFSKPLIQQLKIAGVEIQYVTLHVGAGTFAPVRDADVFRHRLHSERCHVSQEVCDAVGRARIQRRRVIAIGTTTVRVLETAAQKGTLQPYKGETDLFIKPGFNFRVIDALITNFHLPQSTLLMLVCAFGGQNRVMAAYRHAVAQQFRFYSYGDAMIIDRFSQS